MWPSGPPNEKEILKIARRTTDIIQLYVTSNVCLFGSAAASLWADTGRVPNDIDIVVRHDGDSSSAAEMIKRAIVDADDRYFLKPPRRRSSRYKILICRLPGWRAHGRCVKVDILVPPTLNLPEIDSSDTPVISRIPVMPLFDLLVMKTQGWWDHRISPRKDFREKEEADVLDVDALLDRAVQEKVSYRDESGASRHTYEFMDYALVLAGRFVRKHGRPGKWRAIGFPL
ncbi:hypothetical protein EDB92DRAFT_1915289 [Lactarius akahatsu]|uniref:Nucleotidyltransferase n=1 Tax=Lactarius akahatsu TaxID=416441 RepID=A0AAD4L7D5_9AGAM|nr:hypothetical protein EDB92DRAFT_1915289 [Lactarius akahatsu]